MKSLRDLLGLCTHKWFHIGEPVKEERWGPAYTVTRKIVMQCTKCGMIKKI